MVLVFGSSGLLGTYLSKCLALRRIEFVGAGRSSDADFSIDIFDENNLVNLLRKVRPNVIINLVATTDVDECESSPHDAYRVNAEFPFILNRAIGLSGLDSSHVIHLSTDQVYSGGGPHVEGIIAPVNTYAITKALGEKYFGEFATILRVNFFGKSIHTSRKSFSDWLYENLKNQNPIIVFEDVYFSPLHFQTLCEIIIKCIERRPIGVFNAGSSDSLSKAMFAKKMADALGLNFPFVVGKLQDVPLRARRPLDMTMNCQNIEKVLDIKLPKIEEEILRMDEEYGQ